MLPTGYRWGLRNYRARSQADLNLQKKRSFTDNIVSQVSGAVRKNNQVYFQKELWLFRILIKPNLPYIPNTQIFRVSQLSQNPKVYGALGLYHG